MPLRFGSLQPTHMYKVLSFHGSNKHCKEVISTPSDCFGGGYPRSLWSSLCPNPSLMMLVTQVGLLARQPRKSVREIIEALWW